MGNALIFIHSLFRAGSTYLFKVFRRSERGYWCYQEPLHEFVFFNRENPSALQLGCEASQELRHPLDGTYFWELQETWPAWKDAISESIIYDAYFADRPEEIGIAYWQALAAATTRQPVFQECRTCGRIGAIKSQLGGVHIYLWRNPWDQWWSYKVTPYFDITNQLIIHARHAPRPVQLLLDALNLPIYKQSSVLEALAFYAKKPLTSEQSYLVFYMLWCLMLHQGIQHADILLNIDRLSDSESYRAEILAQLKVAGIDGIDFSDCLVPQGYYLEKEQAFFILLENRVHQWLIEGGWTQENIDQIQMLRQRYAPMSWNKPITALAPADLAEQASRARMLTQRYETGNADARQSLAAERERCRQLEADLSLERERRGWLETEWNAAKGRIEELAAELAVRQGQQQALAAELAEARQSLAKEGERCRQLEADLGNARAQLEELNPHVQHWMSVAEQREKQLAAMYASWSWKVTTPLRFGYDLSLGALSLAGKAFASGGRILLWPLLFAMRPVLRDPLLAERINRKLLRFPWLHRPLRALAIRYGLMAAPGTGPVFSTPAASSADSAKPSGLAQLSPRARQIYADLKAALAEAQGRSH